MTEFHRKAEDNIPMVRLRAPAAVRADQDPGHSADVCMNTRTQCPVTSSEPADCSQKPFGTSPLWDIYNSTFPMYTYLLTLDENIDIRQLFLFFTCSNNNSHPDVCKIGSGPDCVDRFPFDFEF